MPSWLLPRRRQGTRQNDWRRQKEAVRQLQRKPMHSRATSTACRHVLCPMPWKSVVTHAMLYVYLAGVQLVLFLPDDCGLTEHLGGWQQLPSLRLHGTVGVVVRGRQRSLLQRCRA